MSISKEQEELYKKTLEDVRAQLTTIDSEDGERAAESQTDPGPAPGAKKNRSRWFMKAWPSCWGIESDLGRRIPQIQTFPRCNSPGLDSNLVRASTITPE